jgi:hypothetical protein
VVDILLMTGRPDDALHVADELLAALAARHARWVLEPEIHRLRGLALAETGREDEAEAALTVSLALADHRGAHLLGVRAAANAIDLRLRVGRDVEEAAAQLHRRLATIDPAERLVDVERAREALARADTTRTPA